MGPHLQPVLTAPSALVFGTLEPPRRTPGRLLLRLGAPPGPLVVRHPLCLPLAVPSVAHIGVRRRCESAPLSASRHSRALLARESIPSSPPCPWPAAPGALPAFSQAQEALCSSLLPTRRRLRLGKFARSPGPLFIARPLWASPALLPLPTSRLALLPRLPPAPTRLLRPPSSCRRSHLSASGCGLRSLPGAAAIPRPTLPRSGPSSSLGAPATLPASSPMSPSGARSSS